jgi:ATP-binding cassette, subfamily B, bacterial
MRGSHGGGIIRATLARSLDSVNDRPQVTWGLLRRVLGYGRPYWRWIVGMLVAILLSTGLSLLSPLILRDLIDRTLPNRDLGRLTWLAIAMLVIPLLTGSLSVIQRQWNARIGEGVVFDLRTSLFVHLQRMSLGFFTHTKVGELMSRLNNDVVGAQNAISNTLVSIVTSLIQAAVILAVMISLEWRLTLVSVAILPIFLFLARRLGNRLRDLMRQQMDANAHMNAVMMELLNISGVLLVKLFGRAPDEDARFRERAGLVRELGIQRAVTGVMFFVSISLLSSIGVALVYGAGGYLVISNVLTVGTIVALGAYLGTLYNALQSLTSAPVDFATSMVSFERVFEVLDLPPDIREPPQAVVLTHVRGAIAFEDVSFHYAPEDATFLRSVRRFGQIQDVGAVLSGTREDSRAAAEETEEEERAEEDQREREHVLEHISFRADPGQLVALVGPSGAGKTTITYLIPRLYDPTAGRILIDGMDVREVSLGSLASQIGMVTQESYLFHDTIRVNLQYARPDAPEADLLAATRAANMYDFIQGLPNGFETVVGERGYRLSGGEKQRLAIARVILKDPRILVLDEATSSLDSHSESLIQEALKRVMAGRTSIVIAHRLSTILAADMILVVDRGRIVEQGRHAELLAKGGLYARLHETQFRRAGG